MTAHDDIHAHRILILDFGSQHNRLIARRIREIGVYCEIHPWDVEPESIREFQPRGVILSGGPETVTGDTSDLSRALVSQLAQYASSKEGAIFLLWLNLTASELKPHVVLSRKLSFL